MIDISSPVCMHKHLSARLPALPPPQEHVVRGGAAAHAAARRGGRRLILGERLLPPSRRLAAAAAADHLPRLLRLRAARLVRLPPRHMARRPPAHHAHMAQGYATSDYALSFLDSLVPPCPNASATHLLLWEFAINDSEMSAEWRREVFPLFLRRAAHLVPHATLCFVVLWPSYARHCFPACPRRLAVWADLTAALARATHRRVFAINVNRLAERMGNHSALFADRHHPSSAGHQMIAGALAAQFADADASSTPPPSPSPPPSPPPSPLPNRSEAYAAFTHYLTSRAASLLHLKPSLPARAIRLAAPLPSEGAIRLHGHAAKPALAAVGAFLNGTQPVSVDAGLSDSKRVDRKTLLWIPACAYGAATYAVGLRFTFVGLNLVLPARGQLYRLRNRSEVSVAAWAYSPHGRLVVSDLSAFDDVPLALKSGLSPIVPQLWFRWDLAEAHGQDEARAFTNVSLKVCSVGRTDVLTSGLLAF